MSTIPQGVFSSAVSAGGNHSLTRDVPILLAFWAAIVFIPWEAFFEENGAAPWALKSLARFTGEDPGNFPWMFCVVTAIFAYLIVSGIMNGLSSRGDISKSRPVKELAKFGDPAQLVAAFEAEVGEAKIRWEKPLLVGTPNFLLMQSRDAVSLIPVDRILWAYDKADSFETGTLFVFGQAGMMSSRQKRVAEKMAERTLHFWVEGLNYSLMFNVPPHELRSDELINYLMAHNATALWGYNSKIEGMFGRDREAFKVASKALATTQLAEGQSIVEFFEAEFNAARNAAKA